LANFGLFRNFFHFIILKITDIQTNRQFGATRPQENCHYRHSGQCGNHRCGHIHDLQIQTVEQSAGFFLISRIAPMGFRGKFGGVDDAGNSALPAP
jgi:hypothetical protein